MPVLATLLGILAVLAAIVGSARAEAHLGKSLVHATRALLWLVAVVCGYLCGYLMGWWA